ncbi:MAG: tyrosine--tRNA ligase [Candidatus Saccharimonadales bacterium]
MTLSEELKWRGFVHQTTYKDITAIDASPITFYWGVDPSSDSMTIGNLVIAVMIRHFLSHGHKAVLLVGGATGLIGDPDGKVDERKLISPKKIKQNKARIIAQYNHLFSGLRFEVVDNYDWFRNFGYLAFLRDIGKFVPMRQMLSREFIKKRLSENGAGISYAEFSYVLIQGYDFLHLFRDKGVSLQVCGVDQWGNSIAGVELIRRIEGAEANVWSAPLVVNNVTGTKFGKSESSAVWLDENKTSVYQFYQFWLNVDDESAESFLKLYTLLDKLDLIKLIDEFKQNRSERLAQKVLAYEVTKFVHGIKKADAARKTTEALFGNGHFDQLSRADKAILKGELPTIKAAKSESLPALLVKASLANSYSDANRLITQGAVRLNGQEVTSNKPIKLRKGSNLIQRGKNNFAIIDH